MASALGAISNSDFVSSLKEMTPFQSDSKALGGSKKIVKDVVKKEVSKPLNDLSSFFAGIDRSLINLVVFAKKSFGLQEKEQKRENKKDIGPMPGTNRIRTGKETLVDTDVKGDKKPILSTLKESFDNVDFGEKMTALLFIGGLSLFLKYKEAIIKALTPLVKLVMGIVDIIGVDGALMALFGIIVGIKLFPVISAATGVVTYLAKNFLPSFKTLKDTFKNMNKFIKNKLIPGIAKSYKKSKFKKILKLLGGAFSKLRFLLTASLYPAIIKMVATLAAAMGPILGPIVIIAAIAAGIAAVLFSLKSGFETFKKALDDGDSMLLAIGKGIADFALTLYTLPLTLLKKVVGYFAGLFGFPKFKEALEKFDFKKFIKDAFVGFVTGFVRVIKAIAKGAAAALAAIAPGGKTPQGEFSRVYNEIMQGGSGQIKVEKSDLEKSDTDSEPELTENEVAKAIDKGEIQAVKKSDSLGFIATISNALGGSVFNEDKMSGPEKRAFEKKQKLEEAKKQSERLMINENQNREARKNIAARQTALYEPGVINLDAKRIDLSTNVRHETHLSGDLDANNQEGSQRLINAVGVINPPR